MLNFEKPKKKKKYEMKQRVVNMILDRLMNLAMAQHDEAVIHRHMQKNQMEVMVKRVRI